ncbi:hypothetical protein URH17368_1724 [Alicyclobacillus hesperidum URH17-3-68]|nr:hypothetical protein URH17368_1724 [Alicyclobacillus hesperidum URH17-3-68]
MSGSGDETPVADGDSPQGLTTKKSPVLQIINLEIRLSI